MGAFWPTCVNPQIHRSAVPRRPKSFSKPSSFLGRENSDYRMLFIVSKLITIFICRHQMNIFSTTQKKKLIPAKPTSPPSQNCYCHCRRPLGHRNSMVGCVMPARGYFVGRLSLGSICLTPTLTYTENLCNDPTGSRHCWPI